MENREVLTKRKTHRRKPGGKRKKDKHDYRSSPSTMDKSDNQMEVDAVAEVPGNASSNNTQATVENTVHCEDNGEPSRKHFRVFTGDRERAQRQRQRHPHHFLQHSHSRKLPHGTKSLLLRPAKVPKAPQNSTQFIIDDHENSAYFIDFEKGFTSPGARDDVGWSPYFEQDFENVYRTARESEVIHWTHEVLVEKISSLEERVKSLEQQLSMCDPNVYMPQLQHRIVCMQDETRQIKEFRIWCPMHGQKVRLRHSVTETSESGDCSSSSQDDKDEESHDDEDANPNILGHGESDNGYSQDINEENDSDDDEDDSSGGDEPDATNEDNIVKEDPPVHAAVDFDEKINLGVQAEMDTNADQSIVNESTQSKDGGGSE